MATFFCGVHRLVSLYPSHPIPLSPIVNKVYVMIAWTTLCGVGLMAGLQGWPAMGAVFCLDPAGWSQWRSQTAQAPSSIHCTVSCSC